LKHGTGWLAALACLGCQEALGQFTERTGADDRFLSRTAPYLPLGGGDQANYNIKWHRITARLRGSVQAEYTDNLTLSSSGSNGDVFIAPHLGTGIFWPLSRKNILQFDLDIGYRFYFKYSKLSTFYVSPSSHIEYRMMLGDVRINLHDDFSIQVDPVSRPEISGGGRTDPVVFRRFINTAGISASWQASEYWTFVGGYDFTIDRSLSDDYASIDRNGHTFSAAVYRTFPPQWTLGLHASYSITDYLQQIQHDGWGYSMGPLVAFQASENLLIDGGVDWSVSRFDNSGSILDRSNFQGMTYHVGARHVFNAHMHHNLRLRKSVDLGLGSNYTDTMALQYGVTATLRRGVTVNSILAYDQSTVSGAGGESSDRYMFYLGTGFALSRSWQLGLGYSFAWKDSDQAGRDYTQNRITLDASYRF
jgi:hypothetical protein